MLARGHPESGDLENLVLRESGVLRVLWISSKCMFPTTILQSDKIKEEKKIYSQQNTALLILVCYVLFALHTW